MHEAYELWKDAGLTALQAAQAIWSDLREIQSEQAPLQAQERVLRAFASDAELADAGLTGPVGTAREPVLPRGTEGRP